MLNDIDDWLKKQSYLDELSDYLRLPSRSSNRKEVRKSSLASLELLKKAGLDATLHETEGNPILIGSRLTNPVNPTVLVYGHHDVQPEGNLQDWNTDPFDPVISNGKLYCRGSADNKGQHFGHLLALRYLNEEHPEILDKINLKFILDGDEELGSPTIRPFVKNNLDLLSCDFVLISDGPSLVTTGPTIVGAVRGIVSFEIKISHNQSDLHSGNFGGVARSATLDMKNLLDSMVDENGLSKIPGFNDNILPISDLESNALEGLKDIYKNNMDEYSITPAKTFDNRSHRFQNQAWSTMNINGLSAGGVGNLRRTIIPQTAIASLDCRLVYNQEPEKIITLIRDFIDSWGEKEGIKNHVHLEFESTMAPPPTALESEYIKPVFEGLKEGFGVEPVMVPRLGGSLPTAVFPILLGVPSILVPLSLPDSRNHGPNENLDLDFLHRGIISSVLIFKNLSEL